MKPDKLAKKRREWVKRTAEVSGLTETEVVELLSIERLPSFRINTLKVADDKAVLKTLLDQGWQGEALGVGYTIDEGYEAVRDSELARTGIIYIQNAASWLPVLALAPKPGEKILDICAAPGGKTSHIAAITDNKAELWINDNSRARLYKMRANLDRLGVQVAEETMFDATQLTRKLGALHPELISRPMPSDDSYDRQGGMAGSSVFDKIMLDAPCSGEGLMNYSSDKDFETWSVAHIKRLQQLQKKLIMQAWRLLKPGGTLVYSTCTMAPEENEAVVDYLVRRVSDVQVKSIEVKLPNAVKPVLSWHGKSYHPDIQNTLRLLPSTHVEAFFVSRLDKVLASEYKLTS